MEYWLAHQTSDFFVHLAKKVHIAVSNWVDAFVFHQEMFKPSFKLVPLSHNG